MTFPDAIKTCFRKYFDFSGRASKAEFWFFVLFCFLAGAALSIIDVAIFGPTIEQSIEIKTTNGNTAPPEWTHVRDYSGSWFSGIFSLATLVPSVSAGWRRLHDSSKSGLRVLLVPAAGAIAIALVSWFSVQVEVDISKFPKEIKDQLPDPFTMTQPSSILPWFIAWFLVMSTFLAMIIWLTRPSTPGTNKYGPNPHEVPS